MYNSVCRKPFCSKTVVSKNSIFVSEILAVNFIVSWVEFSVLMKCVKSDFDFVQIINMSSINRL